MVSSRSPVPEALGRVTSPAVTAAVQLLMVVPAGAASWMTTSRASLGPSLVTMIVYTTSSPGMNTCCVSSAKALDTETAATGAAGIGTVVQSSQPGTGSGVVVVTSTVLLRSAVRPEPVASVTSYTTSAPLGNSAMVSARFPVPEALGKSTVPAVAAAVQLLMAVPVGASSATDTFTASSGPLLVMVMV